MTPDTTAVLSARHVRVSRYGNEVLKDISFTLARRERLAIVGQNGSGKTTLLRTLLGLQRLDSGNVYVFDQECRSEKEFRLIRSKVGFLFQDSDDQLFCPSVAEDVAFGPLNMGCTEDDAMLRAKDSLKELGIEHLAERFSHRLSGGEKRLVCLAGLLAMKPDILLLDEPTNGVDHLNVVRLKQALLEFSGAMIIVSHDDSFVVDIATRVLAISGGKLADADIHEHPHSHKHLHIHEANAKTSDHSLTHGVFTDFRPLTK